MGALYYTVKLSDAIEEIEMLNQTLAFTERKLISRNVKLADGAVTISMAEVNVAKAIFIRTNGKTVTLVLNSASISVSNVFFATLGADITTLTIACAEATPGADVDIVIWADLV